MGVNKELANSAFNAFLEALVMVSVVSIHKSYLYYSKKKQIPEKERIAETISRLKDECWNEKEFYILFVIFFLILTVANYLFIIKL